MSNIIRANEEVSLIMDLKLVLYPKVSIGSQLANSFRQYLNKPSWFMSRQNQGTYLSMFSIIWWLNSCQITRHLGTESCVHPPSWCNAVHIGRTMPLVILICVESNWSSSSCLASLDKPQGSLWIHVFVPRLDGHWPATILTSIWGDITKGKILPQDGR